MRYLVLLLTVFSFVAQASELSVSSKRPDEQDVYGCFVKAVETDNRSYLSCHNPAGTRIRVADDTGANVYLQMGVESATVSNRPTYISTQGNRHFLLDPGSKRIFFASKDPNTNVGDPDGFLHVIGNDDNYPTLVLTSATDQSVDIMQVKDASANVLSGYDAEGNAYLRAYDDATRPSFGKPGRVIFNSDDNNINIDTGSGWVLPDGSAT